MELREDIDVHYLYTHYEGLEKLSNNDLKYVRNKAYFESVTGGKPTEARILYRKLQLKCEEMLEEKGILEPISDEIHKELEEIRKKNEEIRRRLKREAKLERKNKLKMEKRDENRT